jgi:hypothetical protein
VLSGFTAMGMPRSTARQSIIGNYDLALGAVGAAIGVFIDQGEEQVDRHRPYRPPGSAHI